MNNTKAHQPEALARTWEAVTVYRECGVTVSISRDTVTMTRAHVGGRITATLNGEEVTEARAARILRTADRLTVTAEDLAPTPAPVIGKARAHKLHKLLGRFGLPHAYHYQGASEATGRTVSSLASLTEDEARKVWAYLCGLFPTLPQVAA